MSFYSRGTLKISLSIPNFSFQHEQNNSIAVIPRSLSDIPLRPQIQQMFLESVLKMREYDLPLCCYYFQKGGFKPMSSLPIHEVCFGISEITSFIECFINNITRMKYLKKLSMHWNILSYQDLEHDLTKVRGRVQKLGNELRKLKNLEHLVLKISRNQPKSLLSLFKTVVNNKHMKRLAFELQASKFYKEDILRMTSLLKGAYNLQELSLSFKRCMLADDAFKALFDCLDRRVSLKRLRLNFAFVCNLHEDSIQRIINLLKKLPQLDCLYVNLSGTDIEDRHVRSMMEAFSKSRIMKQCYVKVGSCRKVSFMMASEANNLRGFVVSK